MSIKIADAYHCTVYSESSTVQKVYDGTFLATGFKIFIFVLEYLKLCCATIYIIANVLGGRQVFLFPRTLIRIVFIRDYTWHLVLFRGSALRSLETEEGG